MRVPLSWLRDFAPFDGDPAALAATLDDLGLVVEGIEHIGEGLGDVVVVKVLDIAPIEGADKIRRVMVDTGGVQVYGWEPEGVQVVCGAWNFRVGDLVPLAPVGAVLPDGTVLSRRKMKGVVSNGMLCSGRELELSEDHAGILVLDAEEGIIPGQPLVDALGIHADVVFDIAVEANRPDAWSVAGVARDLAARLDIPFAIPPIGEGVVEAATGGPGLDELASAAVDDTELCPRFTARVLTGVQVTTSPKWLVRRLTMAGMRPVNNVVDASNYVMLELGQPTHPYDLDRLGGNGLRVRRASSGERITTLDGVERVLGQPGPGIGDAGEDCLICDAEGTPVGIGGVMGGASSEIDESTIRVLVEAAYFVPMAIARTSKRLRLRTEASARFERGTDPRGIDRAVDRFCELVVATGGDAVRVAPGMVDLQFGVPEPVELQVRVPWVNGLLGTAFSRQKISGLLDPLGMASQPVEVDGIEALRVTVPTFRPDIRPAPDGEADIAEEVARTYGYSRLARRTPAWPQPGRLTTYQQDRRTIKDVLCGVGASEAWTPTFVTGSDQTISGTEPPWVELANPLVDTERYLRSSMAPGLIRALLYNAERRQGELRLFEVGSVFRMAEEPQAGSSTVPSDGPPVDSTEHLCAVFCGPGDDAWTAVGAWRAVAEALRISDWDVAVADNDGAELLHPYRRSALVGAGPKPKTASVSLGVMGELDPAVLASMGLVGHDGRPPRVGWLDLDLRVLLDRGRILRRPLEAIPVSRFPSADIDLAFAVDDEVPAGRVERVLRHTGGDVVESVVLFDVYRGPSVEDGSRGLAFRLRCCSLDRTLDEDALTSLRQRCIDAVEQAGGAKLR